MRALVKAVSYLVVVSVVFVGGYSWRDLWAHRAPSLAGLAAVVNPALGQRPSPTELFQAEFDHIVANAAVSVDPNRLKYSAMSGMFASLGDPHTNFLEPVDADSLKLATRGNFVGIGARLASDPAGAKIAVTFKGAPAAKAGMKAGDTVIEVDGKSTAGLATDDIVTMIRGKEGTTVSIKALRAGHRSPLEFEIQRALVVIPSAEGRMLPGTKIGYISVAEFAQTTTELFDQALDDLLQQKPEGLVLDLRNNPGGLLDTAVEMLGRFMENKVAVRTRKRGGLEETVFTPFGKVKDVRVPVTILINSDSASAAEIFSGVMQDYKKAVLVGEHSYGKSSVQHVNNLIDLSSAKITIAKYFLPSGRDIGRKLDEDGEYQSGGLKPDVEVLPSYDEDTVYGDPAKDVQLRKAIEYIRSRSGFQAQSSPIRSSAPEGLG